jgi:hypothetical protein
MTVILLNVFLSQHSTALYSIKQSVDSETSAHRNLAGQTSEDINCIPVQSSQYDSSPSKIEKSFTYDLESKRVL